MDQMLLVSVGISHRWAFPSWSGLIWTRPALMWKPMIEVLLVPWRVFLGLTRNSCCARSEKTLSRLGRCWSQVWSYRMMRLMWTRIPGRLRTRELSSQWNEASAPRTPRGVWVHWNCPWSGRVNAVVVVACSLLSHLPRQSGKVQGGEKFWLFFFDVGQRLIDLLEFDWLLSAGMACPTKWNFMNRTNLLL